jgi:hypothetical protein
LRAFIAWLDEAEGRGRIVERFSNSHGITGRMQDRPFL